MSPTIHRVLLQTLAALAITLTALALVARTQPISNVPALVLAVGSPYTAVAALAGLILAAFGGRAVLAIIALVTLTATLSVQALWYYRGEPANLNIFKDIRVLSSNLRHGNADPAFIVNLAAEDADVITVSELTAEEVHHFEQAGIGMTFPYSHLLPAPGASGIGMWSRYPLTVLSAPRHRGISIPAARVQFPGLRFEPLLASVHVSSPVADDANTVAEWRSGMAGAKAQLDNFGRAAGPAAVIVGGDYNSTPDMRQFRDLLTDGYRDAVDQLGAGFSPTFPSDRWYPPLITIDHILTRNAAASSIRTIDVPGSDHRALLATIHIPAG